MDKQSRANRLPRIIEEMLNGSVEGTNDMENEEEVVDNDMVTEQVQGDDKMRSKKVEDGNVAIEVVKYDMMTTDDIAKCKICLEAAVRGQYVNDECFHGLFCGDCTVRLTASCPICRMKLKLIRLKM